MADHTRFVLCTTIAKGVVQLTLNRPKSFNALSLAMMNSLREEFSRISRSKDIRVVVIAANGNAFCAGHDVFEMSKYSSFESYKNLFSVCSHLMMDINKLPQPVIAKVGGFATAAGCQLVSVCDLAIAASTAKFAVSGINLGLFCSTPAVGLSRNIGRKKALEMLLTGDSIDADMAVEKGLVNRVVAPADLDNCVLSLSHKIAQQPMNAVSMGKRLFYDQLEMGLEAAFESAAEVMARNMMQHCAQEGFRSFTEKREPSWRLSAMDTAVSPTKE
jgi:enoyl-CoA hydratase/carnithine racemase